jgi:pimeloyl-ACP methyl ester carboxylesterase
MATRILKYFSWMAITLALVTACAANRTLTPTDSSASATIALTPCQLSAPGLPNRRAAQCGTLVVPEDRTASTGRSIELHFAVLKAFRRNPQPDPLFFLTGGPGQAATESYLQLASALARLNQDRDIVLVDQRGTGQSAPLTCPAIADDADETQLTEWLTQCRAGLAADARYYTTSIAMDDLEAVRQALGYGPINLYGVSYGTRAALTYVRQYPANVRAVILDGVVPADEALGVDVARDAQRALELIFARCESDADCRTAFPDLRAEFESLLAELETAPVEVALAHPVTGAPTDFTFTRDTFAVSVRLLSYAPETVALLPLLIHHTASTHDYARFAALSLQVGDSLASSLSNGMAYSVLCAEDEPFFTDAQAQAANANTYLGDAQTAELRQVCAIWPRGSAPADFKEPVRADVPVLLLSGEADPVTPPENAAQVAATLPNSLSLVAAGQGHTVIMRGCLPRVAADFIEAASVAGLDTACVADIAPMPFFINFTGPTP